MTREFDDQGDGEAPFSEAEREALAAWEAPLPRLDLADRVLARVDAVSAAPPPSARWGRLVWRAALVAAAAGLVWALLPAGPAASDGHLLAETRTTAAIGSRGVAVAERGAELSWGVGTDGVADVVQAAGSVFYRVEAGPRFAVRTPLGEVEVTGTCFRVEIRPGPEGEEPTMRSGTKMAAAAVASAALTAAVLVTVYEGRVAVAAQGRAVAVEPGQQAMVLPGRAPTVSDVATPAPKVALAAPPPAVVPAPRAPEPPQATSPEALAAATREAAMVQELARAKAEMAATTTKVASLEASLAKALKLADKVKTFDLGPEMLKEMAERCELRWDHPAIRIDEAPGVDDDAAESVHLDANERAAVSEELAHFNERTLAELRRLYTEVTGDDQVANLAPEAMFAEINDKSEKRDIRLTFEKLAAERAGLATPPADDAEMPPVERVYRLLTGSGDRLEAVIGARIGAEKAKALREYRNGWGSASRSSYGCPKRTP